MTVVTVLLSLVGALLLTVVVVVSMFFGLWVQARASGLPVSILEMLLMRLRRVNPQMVIGCMISLAKAGVNVDLEDLESHVLAGGNLLAVTDALISVEKANLGMDYRRLAAIDLAGRDVVDAVRTHVSPKVLACPPPSTGQDAISGVCQDGIGLAVTARITVRTQLDRLVGGAGEETITARVGEGIVAAIGRAATHKTILEKPETITEYLLARGLDSGTCFEIVSVDVANVSVEGNLGARLMGEQAEADKRVAQARAEARRTGAVAAGREMKARTVEMESRVVGAKSVVPLAAASALGEANIGRRGRLPATCNHQMRWRFAHD